MLSYEEYYNHCKSVYKGDYAGALPLEDLTIHTYLPEDESFEFPNDYKDKITNIHNHCKKKINTKQGLFDPEHENIIKVNDFYGCQDVLELGNFFAKYIESNVYQCYSMVESVLIYESLPNKIERSSWIWHYDDNVHHQLKLMLYLNDVSENTGAFEVLLNPHSNKGLKMKSSKISPTHKSSQVYSGSRVPPQDIESFGEQGWLPHKIVGPAGTFCLFDPNSIHRATTPKEEPHRLCAIYNFRPFHKNLAQKIHRDFTKSWSTVGDVKSFSTDIS
tara:strand:- start:1044 stop:1868 length:825 start_codon:yes stop_codon:yes gene_type:complete